ncbi:transglycosylase SLT domain-containing protein [uncultured Shewanella sp.]|uniref:transglycosylase SLT domain-containing protein n=1 Tax=uncultured Shewanella sp. TaxID=173975 RepID=UPI00260DBA5A|nr:transglycosylase SLT domain-containing protein [uncultured Shewanella sp.]
MVSEYIKAFAKVAVLDIAVMTQLLIDCQDVVNPQLLLGLITNNPYEISAINNTIEQQANTEGEATTIIDKLSSKGIGFNAGIMKIHSSNFYDVGLDNATVFNVCKNINAGAKLLSNCLSATKKSDYTQDVMQGAYACYRAKNFLSDTQTPMQLSPSDEKTFLNTTTESDVKSQQHTVEAWDVFGDFSN